jgi:hypothetical protein
MPESRLKPHFARHAFRLLQWGVLLAIIAYLLFDIHRNRSFAELWSEPKRWDLLAIAAALTLAMALITFIRWYWLMRALDLPVTLRDAIRLGFIGYLLNFVSVGAVGGDLFKAILTARQCPGRRTEAVATVVVDRVLGLYSILLLATGAILFTGCWHAPASVELQGICRATFIATAIGTGGVFLMMLPDFTGGALARRLEKIPKIGLVIERLAHAMRIYRSKPGVMLAALGASLVGQGLVPLAYFLVASGLLDVHPSLASHYVIVPLLTTFSVLPMPAAGLGAIEWVMDYLYLHVTAAVQGVTLPQKNLGVMVSLGYRVVTLVVAMVGVCYYMAARREVAEAMDEVKREHVDSLLEASDESHASQAISECVD